ncbi:MAG: repeat protein, partial [Euryarchaeota archaeon]|nr:repeat protein [Euryarchaeota archaeon]
FGLVFVVAGPDLTGDGQRDLIVYNLGESESAEVMAVKGDDGRLLWSREGMIFIPP